MYKILKFVNKISLLDFLTVAKHRPVQVEQELILLFSPFVHIQIVIIWLVVITRQEYMLSSIRERQSRVTVNSGEITPPGLSFRDDRMAQNHSLEIIKSMLKVGYS